MDSKQIEIKNIQNVALQILLPLDPNIGCPCCQISWTPNLDTWTFSRDATALFWPRHCFEPEQRWESHRNTVWFDRDVMKWQTNIICSKLHLSFLHLIFPLTKWDDQMIRIANTKSGEDFNSQLLHTTTSNRKAIASWDRRCVDLLNPHGVSCYFFLDEGNGTVETWSMKHNKKNIEKILNNSFPQTSQPLFCLETTTTTTENNNPTCKPAINFTIPRGATSSLCRSSWLRAQQLEAPGWDGRGFESWWLVSFLLQDWSKEASG